MSSAQQATDSSHDSSTDDRDEYQKVDFNGVIDVDTVDPILRHLTEIIDEYVVVINKFGWHIKVVEPSNVCMFDIRIHTDDWIEYDPVREGPIGLSHKAFEDLMDFADATDGDAHISIDDGRIEVSDGDRLFMDTELINPDSVRRRPEFPDMEVETSVTVGQDNNDMWDLKKFIRSHKDVWGIQTDVNHDRIQFGTRGRNDDEIGESIDVHGNATAMTDVTASYAGDFLYKVIKKPLKAQLTDVPYTFTFYSDDKPMTIEREYESNSKLRMLLAPKVTSD